MNFLSQKHGCDVLGMHHRMITVDFSAATPSPTFVCACPWAAAAISSSRSGYQGEPSGLGYQGELLGLGYQGATVGLGYQEEEDVMISLAAEHTPTLPFP